MLIIVNMHIIIIWVFFFFSLFFSIYQLMHFITSERKDNVSDIMKLHRQLKPHHLPIWSKTAKNTSVSHAAEMLLLTNNLHRSRCRFLKIYFFRFLSFFLASVAGKSRFRKESRRGQTQTRAAAFQPKSIRTLAELKQHPAV